MFKYQLCTFDDQLKEGCIHAKTAETAEYILTALYSDIENPWHFMIYSLKEGK